MHLYIQIAKTTHFRFGGDGWFRACWEVSQSLADAEKSAATRFCESLFVATLLSFGESCDKIAVILWKGGYLCVLKDCAMTAYLHLCRN